MANDRTQTNPPGGAPGPTRDYDPGRTRHADSTRPGGPAADPAALPNVPGYAVTREIARGGMGRVLAATDLAFGREVAVKVLLPGAASASAAARFVREARVTGRLAHPAIPPAHELGTLPDGSPFLVMKLVRGRTLADLLAARPDPAADLPRLVGVFEQVAQAVGFAHSQGVVHRDLKPANVMVGEFGEVQVMDWGLAWESAECGMRNADSPTTPGSDSAPHTPHSALTKAGAVLGTPAYLPPEQARGEVVDARADVFALGGVLLEVLTGARPFRGATTAEVLAKAAAGDLADALDQLDARGADPELTDLTRRCLSTHPDDRPADGTAVAAEVAAYRAGVEDRLRAAERDRAAAAARAAEARKRRRVQALLAVVGGGAVGLGAMLWVVNNARGVAETARDGEAKARQGAELDRDAAAKARATAETAGKAAVKAQTVAEAARDELKRTREELARVEYARTIRLAQQAVLDNDIPAARRLLAGTRADLRGWEWRYVHRAANAELLTVRSHAADGSLMAFRLSPDGTRLLTTDRADHAPRVRDARTGAVLFALEGHTAVVWGVEYSPDGKVIMSRSQDDTLRLWDAATGAPRAVIRDPEALTPFGVFGPDGRVFTVSHVKGGKGRQTTRAWEADGTEVAALKPRLAETQLRAVSPTGERLVLVRADKSVVLADARTGAETAVLRGVEAAPNFHASFSPDGARVLTTNVDKSTRVWDAATGAERAALVDAVTDFVGAKFSRDGAWIVMKSGPTVRLWDGKAGGVVRDLKGGHPPFVSWESFDPSGTRVVTAGMDQTVRVWDAAAGTERVLIRNVNYSPTSGNHFELTPDGDRLIGRRADGAVCVWDTRTGAEQAVIPAEGDEPGKWEAAYCPDGARLLRVSRTGRVRVSDLRTGAEVVLADKVPAFRVVTVSADGARLLFLPKDGPARAWDARTGAAVPAARPDGARVAVLENRADPRILDAVTGAEVAKLSGHAGGVNSVVFSPDGKQALTAGNDGTCRVWDAATGKELRAIVSPAGRLEPPPARAPGATDFNETQVRMRRQAECQFNSAVFSPDGGRVATAGGDGSARVWVARTGTLLVTMAGHLGGVGRVAFSPDGERLAIASGSFVRVFDARTGTEHLLLRGVTSAATAGLVFSPDGERLVLTFVTGAATVWDVRPLNAAADR